MIASFSVPVSPDWEALRACILRQGTPKRVHHMELFLDREVQYAVDERFGVTAGLDRADPWYEQRRLIALQRFLGYDYVRCGVDDMKLPLHYDNANDTADLARQGGRRYVNEHRGPITTWAEFERYPWPKPSDLSTRALAWYQDHLPDDMCIVAGGGFAHFAEYLSWLMGYETLCLALYDDRELVKAIADRLVELYRGVLGRILQFDRVQLVWGSDDMGHKTGPLISPADLREFVLPGHKLMAEMAHAKDKPYLLHSCGCLDSIMPDLLEVVKMDAKHSFEDTIEDVIKVKQTGYGQRVALIGGIDVDFLCRADEAAIRQRVRRTLAACQPGGGYCLGSGNSVCNYIPLDHYLAMVDEGRRWAG